MSALTCVCALGANVLGIFDNLAQGTVPAFNVPVKEISPVPVITKGSVAK